MKLLHTSDWHVGRGIRGRSRADEHAAVLDEIVGIATDEAVDVVVVAGDLFDTASPTPTAERIVFRAVRDLAATGAEIVIIAGNHDNPHRWKAVRHLVDGGNVHIVGDPTAPDRGGVLQFPAIATKVAVLPFVSKRHVVKAAHLMQRRADQHELAYQDRVAQIVTALCDGFDDSTVNILATHLTVANGAPERGGGEREAHILDYLLPPSIFPASCTYVALGHLHQPHRLAAACPVWYSGSPLHLDFGEVERDHKAVLVVEAEPGLPARVRQVDLRRGRPLRTVRGTVEQVRRLAADLPEAHLRVVLTEPPAPGVADELRDDFGQVVDVRVDRERDAVDEDEHLWDLEDFHRSPADLFAEYLAETDRADEALMALFTELWEATVASDQA